MYGGGMGSSGFSSPKTPTRSSFVFGVSNPSSSSAPCWGFSGGSSNFGVSSSSAANSSPFASTTTDSAPSSASSSSSSFIFGSSTPPSSTPLFGPSQTMFGSSSLFGSSSTCPLFGTSSVSAFPSSPNNSASISTPIPTASPASSTPALPSPSAPSSTTITSGLSFPKTTTTSTVAPTSEPVGSTTPSDLFSTVTTTIPTTDHIDVSASTTASMVSSVSTGIFAVTASSTSIASPPLSAGLGSSIITTPTSSSAGNTTSLSLPLKSPATGVFSPSQTQSDAALPSFGLGGVGDGVHEGSAGCDSTTCTEKKRKEERRQLTNKNNYVVNGTSEKLSSACEAASDGNELGISTSQSLVPVEFSPGIDPAQLDLSMQNAPSTRNTDIIKKILKKHGDITNGSLLTSNEAKVAFLQLVADVVERLQTHTLDTINAREIKIIQKMTDDATTVGFRVNWLHERIDKIVATSKCRDRLKQVIEISERVKAAKAALLELEVQQTSLRNEMESTMGEMDTDEFCMSNLCEGLL